jgi:hypothetical protein
MASSTCGQFYLEEICGEVIFSTQNKEAYGLGDFKNKLS